jgi:hypothetical protein
LTLIAGSAQANTGDWFYIEVPHRRCSPCSRDVVSALCARLLDGGAPGIHFYTLNQAGPSRALWQSIRTN